MKKLTIIAILLILVMTPLGMYAKKKTKNVEVPQLMNYPSAELSEYRLHGGNVVIKGQIAGREGNETLPPEILDQLNGSTMVAMRDYIVGKEKNTVLEFKPDGTFVLNVYVPYPMFVLIYPVAMVYACPGDTLEMTINPMPKSREEAITWDGTGVSCEVTKLYERIRKTYCDFPREEIAEQGLDSLMKWKDRQVAQLDDLVRRINAGLPELEGCSPLAADILRTRIISHHLEHICDTYMRGQYAVQDDNSIDMDAYWQQFFSFVAPRESYLIDNPLLMISADGFFFNRIEYELFRPIHADSVQNYIPFDYDPQIAKFIAQEPSVFRRESRKNAMNELHDKLHISPTDFSAQVCQLRDTFCNLKWSKDSYDLAADDVAAAMAVITHPELIRRAVLTYRDYVKENEIKVVGQKPITKGDSIFQRIIEPYKGNVLYVDFWNMSCGPCRAAMLQMRDEVEANKDKPVKYLYITADKPENCRSFLEPNNIKGEHIHITRSEWGYLQEKFQFTSIPFVVIFDKDGNLREDKTVEELLEE